MSSPFVAEVRIFPFNFAPKGWAFCDGQLLPISQNTALFSLLGTTYGGNGKSTFGLPNIQGDVVVHPGQGPGLSEYFLGEEGGTPTVTLTTQQIPSHNHFAMANPVQGNQTVPTSNSIAQGANRSALMYVAAPQSTAQMAQLAPVGTGIPHENMMPYLTLNFCIALQGIFPSRG